MLADLRKIPLFAGLKDEELRPLADRAAMRPFPKDALVVHEGDVADSLYVVLWGKVKVFLNDSNGRELVLEVKGPGQYFGEMMLDEQPRSASVATLEPSHFAVISRSDFKAFLLSHPEVALHLIRNLIRVARGLNEKARGDVRARHKIRQYIDELDTAKVSEIPSVRRWYTAKRVILVALLVFAVLQYYFFDVFLEMMSLGGINFTGN
ncbi:MAG TPA: cyclic nucleotide-binding domain-containing protein [Burkholderiales bacterium]|jgi:CRP-like cAMP-binding protein|nr:cyclic nucleotide-binding domain-containing protein [Burkholderiales bacterium]